MEFSGIKFFCGKNINIAMWQRGDHNRFTLLLPTSVNDLAKLVVSINLPIPLMARVKSHIKLVGIINTLTSKCLMRVKPPADETKTPIALVVIVNAPVTLVVRVKAFITFFISMEFITFVELPLTLAVGIQFSYTLMVSVNFPLHWWSV